MKAEISIQCDIITDYNEAKKQEADGKIVWTLWIEDDKNYFRDKIIKKPEAGYIIMDKENAKIITSRREEWKLK